MVDASAECLRCSRTFAPDTRHTAIDWKRQPPESRAEATGHGGHLCPDCSQDFKEFLDETPDRALLADGGAPGDRGRRAAEQFEARVGSADPANDPLAGAESRGGYLGFEAPEDYDA